MTSPIPEGIYRRVQATDLTQLSQTLPSVLSGNWSLSAMQSLLTSSHHCRLLGAGRAPGSTLFGFAEFVMVIDECELLNLAVPTEFQGRGYGRSLLVHLLREAKTQGCRTCFLEVRRSNYPAIGLYASMGFTLSGIRAGYYPSRNPDVAAEDALLYSLSLASL